MGHGRSVNLGQRCRRDSPIPSFRRAYLRRVWAALYIGGLLAAPQAHAAGTVVAWGNNMWGQTNVPTDVGNVVGVAAGAMHSLALRDDGTVVGWGYNADRRAAVPVGLSNVVAVACGSSHNVALRADGTIFAWGDNSSGQTNVPAGGSNVVAVTAGTFHSLALRNDGTVTAWGADGFGQTRVPPELNNVVSVAAGGFHSLALRGDGTIAAWGWNTAGQTNVPAGLSNVVAVAAGGFHNLALRSDGTVVAWGGQDYDQYTVNYNQANVPSGLSDVVAVAAGGYHSLALRADGTVVAWGNNGDGQAAVPAALSNVFAVAAAGVVSPFGGAYSLALTGPAPPRIFRQPAGATHQVGATARFSVTATGTAPLSYQWRKNGTNLTDSSTISGTTTTNLTIANVQLTDAGSYTVVVTNGYGSVTSTAADLEIEPTAVRNVALISEGATATANGEFTWAGTLYSATKAIDDDPNTMWCGLERTGTQVLEVALRQKFWIDEIRIVESTSGHPPTTVYVRSGLLQYHDGQNWVTIITFTKASAGYTVTFAPVLTDRLRFTITENVTPLSWANRVVNIASFEAFSSGGDTQSPRIARSPENQTASVGSTASFSVSATGTPPLQYRWRMNGVDLVDGGRISGTTTTNLTLTAIQPADAGDYSVVVSNAYGSVTSSLATLTLLPSMAEALDATNLSWTTGGSAPWMAQTLNTYDGVDAAQSGAISHNQESWLETRVVGPGLLSFWWKVSSELDYDFLEFYINGVRQPARISGSVDWQMQSHTLGAGTQVLRWRYLKDGSEDSGQDAGLVDQVAFTPKNVSPVIVKQWDKGFGGVGNDKLIDLKLTRDGGFIAGGFSDSPAGPGKAAAYGDYDYWVVKFDADSNVQWERTFGGDQYDYLQAVLPLRGGGYLLSGYSTSGATGNKTIPGFGGTDGWIIRLDDNGNRLWERVYGGSADDQFQHDNALIETSDGGFLVAATSRSPANTGNKTSPHYSVGMNAWLLKLDANGGKVWEQTYYNGGTVGSCSFVHETADAYFVAGVNGVSDFTPWSALVDKGTGTLLAQNTYPAGTLLETGFPVAEGGYWLGGWTVLTNDRSYWLARVDGLGRLVADRTLGGAGEDREPSLLALPEGGFLAGGVSSSSPSGDRTAQALGSYDWWLVKCDDQGAIVWDQSFGGTGVDWLEQMQQTPDGAVLLGGYSDSGAFDVGGKSVGSLGGFDWWLVKLTLASPAEITTEPQNASARTGDTVVFSVTAIGTAPLSYQWRKNGTNLLNGGNLSGVMTTNLTIANVQGTDAGNYSVVVTNAYGSVTSAVVSLTVSGSPQTFSLVDYYYPIYAGNEWVYDSRDVGSPWTTTCRILSVVVPLTSYSNCNPVVTYWRNAIPILFDQGGDRVWTNFMHIADPGFGYLASEHVQGARMSFGPGSIFTNRLGFGQTMVVTNEVYSGGVCSGQGSLSIQLVGLANVTVPYGSFPDCLHLRITSTIAGVTTIDEGWWAKGVGPVRWTHMDGGDIETNELRTATFVSRPRVTIQPQSRVVNVGSAINFGVEAIGTAPLSWHWRKDGVNLVDGGRISGVMTTNLTIANVQSSDAGNYTVVVTNAYGSVTSQVATLTIDDGLPWAKRVASTINPDDELAIGLAIDSAANLYATGWFDGTNDFGGVVLTNRSGGGQDVFVAKYSSQGALQWARRAGGSTAESDAGRGVGVDASGNVYVTGGFYGSADFGGFNLTASQNRDFFLAKYDSAGTALWVRQSAGGGHSANGTGIAVDSAGNSYAVGYFDGDGVNLGGTWLTNGWEYNVFLVKYNSAGTLQWAKALNSPDTSYSTCVALDTNANVYVSGSFRVSLNIDATTLASLGNKDAFVAKFNSAGVLQWVKSAGGMSDASAMGVHADRSGAVYACGGFGNASGDTITFAPSVSLTNVGGGTTGSGAGDAFLAKYDAATGALHWAERAGGVEMDGYTGVSTDRFGNVYVAGGADGLAFIDGWKALVSKYDANGTEQWTEYSGGSGAALVWSGPLVDANQNCYVAGWYQGVVSFGADLLEPSGYWDYFLARLVPPTQAAPQFRSLAVSNGVFQMVLDGTPGLNVVVDTSLDLTTWVPWQTNALPSGGLPLAMPMGTNGQFFRARIP